MPAVGTDDHCVLGMVRVGQQPLARECKFKSILAVHCNSPIRAHSEAGTTTSPSQESCALLYTFLSWRAALSTDPHSHSMPAELVLLPAGPWVALGNKGSSGSKQRIKLRTLLQFINDSQSAIVLRIGPIQN